MDRTCRIMPHLAAGIACLAYAYAISGTGYVRTGLQFVAPMLVILAVHAVWMAGAGRVRPGRLLSRGGRTAVGLIGLTALVQLTAPMPSQAYGVGDAVAQVLGVLFCLAILALVVGLIAGAIWVAYLLIRAIWRRARPDGDRRDEFGSLALVTLALIAASLEGVPGAYSFDGAGGARAERTVAAPPQAVWEAMETATSPAFALPPLLRVFPQPVAVPVDEGVGLGARRHVRIAGREGSGLLRMRVSDRSATHAQLTVERHGSPMAQWIDLRAIRYDVRPTANGTRVAVTLDYDRPLAPAWVFGPMMRAAAWGAMDVLARDVAARAEAQAGLR